MFDFGGMLIFMILDTSCRISSASSSVKVYRTGSTDVTISLVGIVFDAGVMWKSLLGPVISV